MSNIQLVNEYWMTRGVHRSKSRIKQLHAFLKGRGFVAGSFAAWACSNENKPWRPQDIDIFAVSDDGYTSLINDLRNEPRYYWDLGNNLGHTIEIFRPRDRRGLPIQLIRPSPAWKDFPADLLNSFDLDVCRAVIVASDQVLCDLNAGEFVGKVLRINNPLRTFKRIMKYKARGVSFMDHELLKVFRAWDEVPQEKKEAWIAEAAAELQPEESPFYSDFWEDDDWFEAE